MKSLFVVGGRLRTIAGSLHRETGALFEHGVLAEVDLGSGVVTPRLEWRDPEWDEDPEVSHVFKGVSWDGDQLLVATQRNLLWVNPVSWKVTSTWTHRGMNDVHHAARFRDRVWVASTGLDGVLEVIGDGRVVFRSVVDRGQLPFEDMRTLDLAPTQSHPNHLFEWEDEVWATRFQQGDAVCLTAKTPRQLPLSLTPVHDGFVHRDGVYFTTVDGRVLHQRGRKLHTTRLRPPDDDPQPMGWCRGLLVGGHQAWVGFTRIRVSRFREHVAWVGDRLDGTQFETRRPTRLQRHDLRDGSLLATVELEEAGLGAVFGIVGR